MSHPTRTPVFQTVLTGLMFIASLHFAFEAVQGNYGLFARLDAGSNVEALDQELAQLNTEIARMENLTRRLSDDYLDIDLLDEQARAVLGMIRHDEVVLR